MVSDTVFEARNVGVCYRQRMGLMRYESFWGLSDITFDLKRGETLGIIGNNGAGKSTLLRVVAGILDPSRGSVARGPDTRFSLLALSGGFRPELSGRENAMLGAMLLGMSKSEASSVLPEIEAFADIGHFFDQPVISYSSGMRARLGFSIANYANPDVLLIDEILGVGDQDFREKSSRAMREKIESDKTVVLVSHSLESVSELCDRVLWIERGKSIGIGPADKMLAGYREAVRRAVIEMRKVAKQQPAPASAKS